MKTYFFSLIITISIFLSISSNAQQLEGIATYQSKRTVDMSSFSRGGQQVSEAQKKQMKERMKQWLEKEYTLTFNKDESFYKEEEKLQAPGQGGGFSFGGGFSEGGIYSNRVKNDYARENNMMGKTFLVKDTLNNLNWELVKESKVIGQYPVFKAVATRPIEQNLWNRLGRRARELQEKNDSIAKAGGVVEKEEPNTEEIVAWYTPMIPASHGPDEFGGLPGLILELNTSNITILCTKVVLNPNNAISIEPPSKGKEVNREEYAQILEEKGKEMSERYGRGGRRGQGRRGF